MDTHTLSVVLILGFIVFVLALIAIWNDDSKWHRNIKH